MYFKNSHVIEIKVPHFRISLYIYIFFPPPSIYYAVSLKWLINKKKSVCMIIITLKVQSAYWYKCDFFCYLSWTQRYTRTLPSSKASRSLCWTDCTSCTLTTVPVRSCCVRTTALTRPSSTSHPISSTTVNWFPVGTSQHILAITLWRFSRREARTCSTRTAQDSIILLRYVYFVNGRK